MPLIVTDSDVLAQVQADDGLAASVDGQLRALGTKVPAATAAAWAAYLAGYQAWSKTTTDAVSGGFFSGAWFGVPEMGDQAIARQQELGEWQAIANGLAAGKVVPVAASPVDPNSVANANASVPGLNAPATGGILAGPGFGTTLLIALGIGVVALVALRK